jgi:hypothetical protein
VFDNDDVDDSRGGYDGNTYGRGKNVGSFSDYLSKLANNTIIAGVTCGMASALLTQKQRRALLTIGINASFERSIAKLVFIATIGHTQSTVFNVSHESGRNLHAYLNVTSHAIETGLFTYSFNELFQVDLKLLYYEDDIQAY